MILGLAGLVPLRRSATVPLTVRMTLVCSVIATVTGPVALWTSMLSAVIPMTIPLTGPLPPGAARLDVAPSPSAASVVTTTAIRARGDRVLMASIVGGTL